MGLHGAITDDTQMTLFTAEGIMRARVRGVLKGICHPPSVIHHALLRWYRTQGRNPKVQTDDVGLINDQRLRICRAPGNTCLASLAASAHFGDLARNNSKGCGTIMRVAPVALMFPRDQVRAMAIETSALTHGHQTGQLAAAAWAEMLADVIAGADLEESATRTAETYARLTGGEDTVRAIQAALRAPRDGTGETVESLGGGWTAEEALSIALYACLAGDSFEEALLIAATHGGDSDSTAAIAGNMLGLLDPAAVLRHRWAEIVEGADIISQLVRDYRELSSNSDAAEELFEVYPGG
jgi:ADP-ribosylglycohydrolase